MAKLKIINSKNLSIELQQHVKAGNPLVVTKYKDEKTGQMKGKDGRIIWDGKNFIFFPEKVKL